MGLKCGPEDFHFQLHGALTARKDNHLSERYPTDYSTSSLKPLSPPLAPLPSSRYFQDAFSLQPQHSFLPQTQNCANPQNQTSKNPTHRSQPNLKVYSAHQPSHPPRRRAKPEKSKETGAQATLCAQEEDGGNGRGGDEGCRCGC